MAIRAFAIVTDMGVMFLDRQLLVFPRRKDAEHKLAALYSEDSGQFDEARIERIAIERQAGVAR